MDANLVITIGRQCGSGGRKIGQILGEKLGVKCYDKELLTLAAQDSGLCKELFEENDEKAKTSFLTSLFTETYSLGYSSPAYMGMPIQQRVFLAQFETIRKLEKHESCIIVGRCADYVLSDCRNVTTVFITGLEKDRIKRLVERHGIDENAARDLMTKADKNRSSYYNYFSNKQWGNSESYDLCINSSALELEGTADTILEFAKSKFKRSR